MTDHQRPDEDMPDEILSDAEIERLLRLIADDQSVTFPRRRTLRRDMLATFEDSAFEDVASAEPFATKHARDADHHGIPIDQDHDVALLRPLQPSPAPRSPRLRLVAAALLIVAIGSAAALSLAQHQTGTTEIDTAARDIRFVAADTPLPAPIDAGTHRTEVFGVGITLEIPAGLEVLEESPGVLILGRQGDQSDPRARISLVAADNEEPLTELLQTLEGQGFIQPQPRESVARRGQELVSRWELSLTNAGAEHYGCESPGPCVPLGPIDLWSRGSNFATELEGPSDERIWWVEQSTVYLDPLFADSAEIFSTLRFH